MKLRRLASPTQTPTLSPEELRKTFLLDDLFAPGKITLHYVDLDRAVVGSAVPTSTPLELKGSAWIASETLCQNRELGILNLGNAGTVSVDGNEFSLETGDCLYIGRGAEAILLASATAHEPAEFYLLSYPASVEHPTKLIRRADANPIDLGETGSANVRRIYKMIHPGTVETCQLMMGYTELSPGSVWNTMPCHTHERRSEVYLYYNLPDDAAVMHFMGEPDQTRHLVVRSKQAVLSPTWSIHTGCGTRNYSFVWGMGGENQDFDDMDWVSMDTLR
ncbi:MAG: 5-dehydro-4-deoxy-D-glucuronate isomerase [Puniceicoccales bacterium]